MLETLHKSLILLLSNLSPIQIVAQQQTLKSNLYKDLKNMGTNNYYPPFISPIPALNGKTILSINGELGITDGTVAGTKILKDLNNNNQSSQPYLLGVVNGLTLFAGNDGIHGYELWKTDGTENGTVMVKDIIEGSTESIPTFTHSLKATAALNNLLFFPVYIESNQGFDLWKSDGSPNGTSIVKSLTASLIRNFLVYQNTLYFTVIDGGINSQQLWRSDGTEAGTYPIYTCSAPAGQNLQVLEAVGMGGDVYFNGADALIGQELFKYSIAQQQVSLVKDMRSGSNSGSAGKLTVVNNQLYFTANDGTGTHLFKTDGTDAGTTKTKDFVIGSLINYNNQLFFTTSEQATGLELWKTDGTNTQLVKDIQPGEIGSGIFSMFVRNNTLIFTAQTSAEGLELWRSDGTEAGTYLIKDINPGSKSGIPSIGNGIPSLTINNTIFLFSADDGVNGEEIWKSDGTTQGTTLLNLNRDLELNTYGEFVAAGNSIFFSAVSGVHGKQLWFTDGNSKAIIPKVLPDDNKLLSKLTSVGNQVYFMANQANTGYELWKSDGTPNGTQLVKDIRPGAINGSIGIIKSVGNKVYFSADDGTNGTELWLSDGTNTGTTLVKDIGPGTASSFPGYLTALGNQVYFTATTATEGNELWKSDGTTAGTQLVKDIMPGVLNSNTIIFQTTNSSKYLYFNATHENGGELWRTDDTNGAVEIKDINPGNQSSNPYGLAEMGDHYYFSANNGINGFELWRTNGTLGNAELIKDINPGPPSSNINEAIAINGVLYFAAIEPITGSELWKTDGTPAGTILLKDIVPGAFDSYPADFINHKNELYFIAGNGFDKQLWKSNGTPQGTQKVILTDLESGESIRKIVAASENLFYVFTSYGKIIKCFSEKDDDVVSVTNHVEENISIFPNPVSEWLTLNLNEINGGTLHVIEPSGERIKEIQLHKGLQTLDVRKFKSGLYIFSIEHKNATYKYRVIIQH